MQALDRRPGPDPDALFARWRASRDPDALGALFDASAPGLFRLALSLTPDAAAAEDALQETFLFAMAEAERHDAARPVLPWLAGILRLKVLEERRRNARAPSPERVAPPAPPEDPELAAMDAEERERLHEAMRRLPEPYRGVALLRWRYGLEPAEIAEVRGVAPGTVWSWLHRAVARLKVSMGALPALLVAFRRERGLDGVRRALLRQAAAKAAVSAASGAATAAVVTTMGGFFMANKAIAVGAAALLLGAAGWMALGPGGAAPAPAPAPEVARAPVAAPPEPSSPPAAAPAEASVEVPSLPPPVDLSKCDRDLDLFGEVVDGEGKPVAGAVLQVEEYPWRGVHSLNAAWRREMRPGPRTLSAIDGTFTLRLARGRSVPLRVRKDGHAERFLDQCLAGERLRVVLGRGADLEVTVRDAAGAPVAGTELRLWRVTGSYGIDIERRGVTDAAGRFVFDALSPGQASLSSEHPKHALPNWIQPEIPEKGTLAVEIAFPEARIVTGKVTDARTGSPLAGARVGIGWTMEMPVTTAADGTYRVETWAPKQGRSDLHARAEGFVGLLARVPDEGDLDFELTPGDAVAGRLVDSSGRPIGGALLSVLESKSLRGPRPPRTPWETLHGRTEPDGRFHLRGLGRAAPHTLVSTAAGHGRLFLEFPPAEKEGGTTDLGDLVLGPGRALEGVVLDLEGRPAPGVGVVLNGRFPDRGRLLPGGTPSDAEPARSAETRRTDDLGRFRFADLPPGPWIVSARLQGAPPLEREVVVPPDRDLLGVRLGGADEDLTSLTVRVVDDAGSSLSGVTVHLYPDGKPPVTRESDAQGLCRFVGLPRTSHTVQVLPIGTWTERLVAPPPSRSFVPSGQEIRLVLHEAAELRGAVVDGSGDPVADLGVAAYDDADSIRAFAFTDERGEFTLRAPRGVALRLAVTGQRKAPPGSDPRVQSERSPLRGEVRGVAAPASGIRIVAKEPATNGRLEVLVLGVDGSPFAGVTVSLQGGAPFRGTPTDAQGKVVFEGLGPDRTMVLVQPSDRTPLPEDAVPPAGQWVEPAGQVLTLQFSKGVILTGRVLLPDGSPAVGARVSAFEPAKSIYSVQRKTDADGRFRVAFPAGERPHINSSLTAADKRFLIGFLESVEPGAQDLEIRLKPKGE